MIFCMLKNDQYKVVDKEFEESDPSCLPTDILTLDYNKLKLEDDMEISCDEKPCNIYLKTACAKVIKAIISKEIPGCK